MMFLPSWIFQIKTNQVQDQGRRKVWKSGGGACSNVVGIMCPPPRAPRLQQPWRQSTLQYVCSLLQLWNILLTILKLKNKNTLPAEISTHCACLGRNIWGQEFWSRSQLTRLNFSAGLWFFLLLLWTKEVSKMGPKVHDLLISL